MAWTASWSGGLKDRFKATMIIGQIQTGDLLQVSASSDAIDAHKRKERQQIYTLVLLIWLLLLRTCLALVGPLIQLSAAQKGVWLDSAAPPLSPPAFQMRCCSWRTWALVSRQALTALAMAFWGQGTIGIQGLGRRRCWRRCGCSKLQKSCRQQ